MIQVSAPGEQYKSMAAKINRAIIRVMESGWYILGKNVEEFEKEFSGYCGSKFGIGVGSGTEALHLALVACGIKQNDEVITVPNTAVPTCSAISFAGAIPVFADVDHETYNIDPAKIEQKISSKTIAIIPVHLYGQCADMEPIMDIAQKYNLKVIEDCAQSHGAEYKGKKAGTIGDIGCFSFYPTKNLGAYGDGGMIITNNKDLAKKVRLIRNYGQEGKYFSKIKGFNSRLDELQAAILRIKLKYLDKWNSLRRGKAMLYNTLLKDSGVITPYESDYNKHIYHLYVIRTKYRNELQKFLYKNGIMTLVHYPIPIYLQESYRDLNIRKGSCPVAEKYAKEILSLPLYPELNNKTIQKVCKLIKTFMNKYK